MASQKPPRINSESIRYIDSSFDQSDSLSNRNQNPDATLNLSPIPYSDGKMVGPGQGGFRLADTPQAWVFIQKKEWLDDTWTYVINDPTLTKLTEDIEVTSAELEQAQFQDQESVLQLQQKLDELNTELDKARQQMADNGMVPLIDGKLAQINIRSALSNIITRKIDWVADHEKFTKSTADYNNSVEMQQFSQQKKYITNNFGEIQKELQSLKASLKQNYKTISDLQKEGQQIRKEILNLRSKIAMQGNNAQKLSDLEKERQGITDQITIIDSQHPNPDSSTKIAEAKSKILPLEQRVLELQKIPPRVPDSVAEQPLGKAYWDKKYAEFAQELSSKQAEIASLQSLINSKNGEQAEYEDAQKEIAELSKQRDTLDLEIVNLKEEIKKETIEKQKQDIIDKENLKKFESIADINQQVLQKCILERDALTRQIQGTNSPTFNFDTGKLYAPVTFSGNAYTRYYKSPLIRTKTNTEAKVEEEKLKKEVAALEKDLIDQTRTGRASSQNLLLQKQLEYIDTKRRLDKLSTQLASQQMDASVAIEIGKEDFNGVIELANISRINTTVSLEGEGSASFTIENPQNIFFIGQEDIDLALSPDPFLENSKDLEGMVYYRGRFYPSHIVDMLTRRKGYSAGTFNTKEALSASIGGQIEDLNKQIREIDVQLSISSGLLTTANRKSLESKQAAMVADRTELQRQQRDFNNSLSSRIQQQTEEGVSAPSVESAKKMMRQTLMKYYLGKAIFQVMDRVYIWMTSPTRTLHQLSRQGEQFAVEDQSAILMARQVPAMEEKLALLQTEKQRLDEYFWGLGFQPTPDGFYVSPGSVMTALPMLFKPDHNLSTAKNTAFEITPDQALSYYQEVRNEIVQVQATIEVLQKQAKSTDYLTGAMTFNKVPSGIKMGEENDEQRKIISDYDSRYLGIEEDRLQVFQGIVSSVKQTFSDGKYQISFSCRDNLFFLSMSRIMTKPALRADQDPQGILQDPIWRENSLAGNWKNGIVVLDYAFINDEVRSRINKKFNIDNSIQANLRDKKVLSEEESKIYGVTPYVTSLPFARIDAANLISFTITGFPYNFKSFIKNAAFGGRLSLQRGAADQRSEKSSYFAFLKRQIGELNDRLGDFEPYIDLQGNQFNSQIVATQIADYTKQLGLSTENLKDSYTRYILKRMAGLFKRLREIPSTSSNAATSIVKTRDPFLKSISDNGVLEKQSAMLQSYMKAGTFEDITGKTNLIMGELVKVIESAVGREKNTTTMGDVSTLYNRVFANETEINNLIEIFFNGKSDLGAFQIVKELVVNEARSVLKISNQGGVNNPTPRPGFEAGLAAQAAAQPNNFVNNVAKDALIPFVKSLLTIQPDFATEYYNAALIASNLNNLNDVQDDVKDYMADIQSQSASIQMALRDGPQATLEKIVRSEKKNFLIISDQYELDLDLQAYQSAMSTDFALWQSEWETPMSICKRAADQVDFEFYADENGNLQFKPPSYNRILKEHFALISETDGQVRNAVLVRYGGVDGLLLKSYLRAISVLRQLQVEFSAKHLLYTKESAKTASARSKNIPSQSDLKTNKEELATQARKVDAQSASQDTQVQAVKDGALSRSWEPIPATPDSEQQAEKLSLQMHLEENLALVRISSLDQDKEKDIYKEREAVESYKTIIADLEQQLKKETDITKVAKINKDIRANTNARNESQSKANGSVSEIEIARSKAKMELYKQLYSNIEFLLKEANKTLEIVRQKTESFVNTLPHFMDEHRIHRVADYDLINYDLSEDPPKFTYLEVTGSPELVQITPAEYYWAGGVDYDNWRQYGFISESLNKAYFHSGDQARTYLRAMLGRERGRIFKASLSVRGDSKYRVGDCVFIESLGMYFYISSTTQSFSYGGDYTTSLSLTYGRRIGEIIPHPFDVLGKIMIDIYQSDLEVILAQQKYISTKAKKSEKNT